MSRDDERHVAVASGPTAYGVDAPFSPAPGFAEYPFAGRTFAIRSNDVYAAVRQSLHLLGMDAARFGTRGWNPLGALIHPGDTVVLKPNFVRDFRETLPGDDDCLITHGAVIRAVADYVFIALGGRGRIVVCDAPQNDADFAGIRRISRMDEIQGFYRREAGFDFEVYDLRPEAARKIDGVIVGHEKLPGDPAGYTRVNLGLQSMFAEVDHLCNLLYGSEYDTDELFSHHHDEVHEYLISRTVLEADCVISLAKLKTHKKTGVTLNLKNLVGINGNKNWLPHHRAGTPSSGGDQFASDHFAHRLEGPVLACFKRLFPLLGPARWVAARPIKRAGRWLFGDTNGGTIRSGNWYGNDTTWRMVLDLNRVLSYADPNGSLHRHAVRRRFNIVDGIVGGQGNGPLDPTPRPAGLVIAGANAVAVDMVCAHLMGFDIARLPVVARAMEPQAFPLIQFAPDEIGVFSSEGGRARKLEECTDLCMPFEPHFGWKGHVERISAPRNTPTTVGVS